MSTYLELQQRIADELDDDDLRTGGQIAKAIKSAIAFHERRRFYFNTTVSHTFSTVDGQEFYGAADLSAIPDIISIFWMYVTVSGVRYPVLPVPGEMITQSQSGYVLSAPPRYYSYEAQQIRLYGIPNAIWTVTMSDLYRLPELSADGDSNAWTTDAEELIRQTAERIIMRDITKEIPRGSSMLPAEQEALDALYRETRLRMGNTTLRADDVAGMQGNRPRANIYADQAR
jgi:hypothetical protein